MSPVKRRTALEVIQKLDRYERENADLPASTRRLMGISALAKGYGRKILEEAFGKLPTTPFRDHSWRWWNVLLLSGLESKWDKFRDLAQSKSLRSAAKWLKKHTTKVEWALFCRRAGAFLLENPANFPHHLDHRRKKGDVIWTKGGSWRIEHPLTKIIVLKQHLPRRPLFRRFHHKLGHEGIRLLERELMHAFNPDAMLTHECKEAAMTYIRQRIPEMLNTSYKSATAETLAWFLQTPIANDRGTGYFIPCGSKILSFNGKPEGLKKSLSW